MSLSPLYHPSSPLLQPLYMATVCGPPLRCSTVLKSLDLLLSSSKDTSSPALEGQYRVRIRYCMYVCQLHPCLTTFPHSLFYSSNLTKRRSFPDFGPCQEDKLSFPVCSRSRLGDLQVSPSTAILNDDPCISCIHNPWLPTCV